MAGEPREVRWPVASAFFEGEEKHTMSRYSAIVTPGRNPQREKARPDEVENNAGGFVFALDRWKRLDRFLILGTEGGTYYAGEREHTLQACAAVAECVAEDGPRAVGRIAEISDAGRAPKNDPAIFALAMCAGSGDKETRRVALAAIPRVCRIGTHLFHFAEDVEKFRRWGRGLRSAVGAWYNAMPADKLALQIIKYQQRDGWSHKDLLRLAHPSPASPEHRALFRYVALGAGAMGALREVGKRDKDPVSPDKLPAIVAAFEEIHGGDVDPKRAAKLVSDHKLPHECVPTELKNSPVVWEALLPHMGLTALVRNLGKLSSLSMTEPLSARTKEIASRLADGAALKKARVHPMAILLGSRTYASGHGLKGSLSWQPERAIVDALDEAFYLAFDAVEPTGKATMLALDVSGSMGAPMGTAPITCREASAAMAMVTARTEKDWMCVGFTASGGSAWGGGRDGLTRLGISPRQRLSDAVGAVSNLSFGNTDCALPMMHAIEHKLAVDTFVIYTDSETWAGGSHHPFQALAEYRQKSGRPAKLVVVAMTSTGFTIADPRDGGMLDVVGFDAATPAAIAEFMRG